MEEPNKDNAKYVILEGLVLGNRFFTSHPLGEEPDLTCQCKISYKILGFAYTVCGAQKFLYGKCYCNGTDHEKY